MSTELVMSPNHLILCCPLVLLSSIFPSIRVFSNESVFHIRWPKYWSFSFSISPSNEYSELISFRLDWLDLFAVQGTLKSLLQYHNLKASVLWHSAFLISYSLFLPYFQLRNNNIYWKPIWTRTSYECFTLSQDLSVIKLNYLTYIHTRMMCFIRER